MGRSEPGSFPDWMYFHRGRLSLAASAWSPALQLALAKSQAKTDTKESTEKKAATTPGKPSESDQPPAAKPDEKKVEEENRNKEDRAFLRWLDTNAPAAFVPWKQFKHPDFPGKKVELGGWAPFARTVPPEPFRSGLAQKHARFLSDLARKLPRIGIRQAEAKPLGESVYEVTLQVENTGYLPTALEQGDVTREVHPTRVVFKLDDGALLSGSRRTLLGPIAGSGGMKEVRCVIRAKNQRQLEYEVISMLGGSVRGSMSLNEKE